MTKKQIAAIASDMLGEEVKPEELTHNYRGNCWKQRSNAKPVAPSYRDICKAHSAPRGECDVCPPCGACDRENKREQ